MGQPKIALNMIVRNCADYIEKALNSTKGHVDYYVIGYGGKSTDKTAAVVKTWLKKNAKNYREVLIKWEDDFSKARNEVLRATEDSFPDAEWLFWLDADDVVLAKENFHNLIQTFNCDVINMPYFYQKDEKGQVVVWHERERLVRLSLGWTWIRPVHETLYTPTPHKTIYTDKVVIDHDANLVGKTRSKRNKDILFKYMKDNPQDQRTKLYIGHNYFSSEDWGKAVEYFADYAFNPENELEQWSAMVFAGRAAFALKDYDEAIKWYTLALNLRPEWKDPYIGLGQAHTRLKNYDAAVDFFKTSDTKTKPPSVLFIVESEYGWNRMCYEHEALASTGRIQEAYDITKKALVIDPSHQAFKYWNHGYMEMLAAEKSMDAIEHLAYTLLRRGDGVRALKLLKDCVPCNIYEEQRIKDLTTYVTASMEQLFDPSGELFSVLGTAYNDNLEKMGMEWIELHQGKLRIKAIIQLLDKYVARAKAEHRTLNVVDLGCSIGTMSSIFAMKYGKDIMVVGIDQEKSSIDIAKRNAKKWKMKNVKFITADVTDLNTMEKIMKEEGPFDVSIAMEIIEHVLNPALVFSTASDMAPVTLLSTPHNFVVPPNDGEVHNPKTGIPLYGHVQEYRREDLEGMALMTGSKVNNLYFTDADPTESVPGYCHWILEFEKITKDFKYPVTIYTGRTGGEEWDERQIDAVGLGGSETAAIRMAEEFVKRGHVVYLYGPKDGVHNGVIYRKAEKFNPETPAGGSPTWLFISSRIPDIVDQDINAAVKVLWCHDNTFKTPTLLDQSLDRLTPERAEKFDYIFVLSDWADVRMREQYPFVRDDQWVVTSNGITAENFIGLKEKRVKHSFIWASSLDRGLETVLEEWPVILEKWPDATLDIFYGLDVMEKLHGHIPQARDFMQRIQEMAAQKGVTWKGRIGQKELAKEFGRHQFWFYPTSFEETFCIVAVEAQAAGCIPCTTDIAALKERVPAEFVMNGTAPTRKLLELDKDYPKGLPVKYRNKALEKTWSKVADQWLDLAVAKVEANAG